MKLFKTVQSSLYNPDFYIERQKEAFSIAFRYFLKLVVILAFIISAVFTLKFVPVLTSAMNTLPSQFPADLAVTVLNGHASTNVSEPYFIPLTDDLRQGRDQPKNLLVIDTKAVADVATFEKYDTMVLLSKDFFVTQKGGTRSQGSYEIQSLKSFPDITVSQAKISEWIGVARNWLVPTVIIGFIAGTILVSVVFIIGYLFELLLLSLLVFIINLIRKVPVTYGETYKLGLYALTGVVILDLLTVVSGIHLPGFVEFVLFLVIIFVNMKKFQPQPKISQ